MSTGNNNDLPPRIWYRVQNSCSLDTNDTRLGEMSSMLNKGNILQYKTNGSNITKAQRYSRIAKGQWINNNTTWASQSTRGYSNPNTSGLKRYGNITNVAIDPITGGVIGPTLEPVTCPQQIIPINEGLPVNSGGGSDVKDPNIPPPVKPTPKSNTFPTIVAPSLVDPIVIQDGGHLICSIRENICSGETKSTVSQQLCNPTTDSDVPGPAQLLCWNNGTHTWYPKTRRIMSNSNNKWPVNAKLTSNVSKSCT